MKIRIFTDGACSENPGPGGWASAFIYGEKFEIISGNEQETTNNRMELKAVIKSLEKIIKEKISGEFVIHSDSSYVVNAVNCGWLELWKRKNWVNARGENVKNKDLWLKMIDYIAEIKNVSFVKVKGHSGNTFNEIVDQRAREEVLKAKAKLKG